MSKEKHIVIVDYNVGNTGSVANALTFLGYDFSITSEPDAIRAADVIVLPGVGAFAEAMNNLKELGLTDVLREEVEDNKKIVFGICLGFQILAEEGHENGVHTGLGFIPGSVEKITPQVGLRVPHVGWNTLDIAKKDPLFSKIDQGTSVYFDHSYHFVCEKQYVAATTAYGTDLVAAVQHENVYGVQFHPEKSQNGGLRILRSFFESALGEA